MLRDRVETSISLYNDGRGKKIIMSGSLYEVTHMRDYAIEKGIDEDDIILDEKGLSTSKSILIFKEEYDSSLIVVSQKYHLYRATYMARKIGLKAYGEASEDIEYYGQFKRDVREVLARVKDFFYIKKFVDK